MCTSVLPTCSLCITCVPWKPEGASDPLEVKLLLWATLWVLGSEPRSVQEQQGLVIVDSSLQSPYSMISLTERVGLRGSNLRLNAEYAFSHWATSPAITVIKITIIIIELLGEFLKIVLISHSHANFTATEVSMLLFLRPHTSNYPCLRLATKETHQRRWKTWNLSVLLHWFPWMTLGRSLKPSALVSLSLRQTMISFTKSDVIGMWLSPWELNRLHPVNEPLSLALKGASYGKI